MAEYINGSTDILGGSVIRYALNTTTPNQAVIRKIIAGNGISILSTGIDPGTGDVTISIDTSGTGGSGAGGGTPTAVGTVTSVNMTAPEGLFVLGAPITNAGTIALRLSSGYIIPLIDDLQKGITAYNDKIVSLSYNTSSGVITLTRLGGGSMIAAITLSPFTTSDLAEGTNLYYTNTRARSALSFVAGSGAYNSATGVITIPTNTNQLTNGAGFITGNQNIIVSGDATGSGTTAITLTLATVNSNIGTFNNVTVNAKGLVTAASNIAYQVTSEKGLANGYASLNSSGQIPSTQLPSYVDDVLEYADLAAFPGSGETGKIYVTLDTNKTYRWSGSVYIEISASPGSTDAVAEGSVNLYFTNARARAAISLTTTGDSGASTYSSATGVINVPTYTLTGLGGVPTTRTITINGTSYDLSANRSWSVGTVTGSGSTNVLPKWTSASSIGNSLLDDDGTSASVALASGGAFNVKYLSAIKLALTGGTTFGSIDVPIGLDFLIRPDSIEKFRISSTGLLRLANYGSGSVTGTVTYRLAVDSTGNVIEVTDGGGTVTSVSGAGTVSGLTLTGTVTGSGSLTLGGTLTLTSEQVTTALGYTPYNAANPNGYISSYTETDTLASVTARGATTSTSIAINAILTVGGGADFYLRAPAASSDPGDIVFLDGSGAELHRLWSGANTLYYRTNGGTTYLMWHSGNLTNLNQLSNGPGYITGYTETDTLASVTGRGATTSTATTFLGTLYARKNQTAGDYTTAALWVESYGNTTTGIAFHILNNQGKFLEMRTDGILYWHGSTVWHAGNLTNLNQLSNGPGYITGYSETDTLTSVTGRGASTPANITIANANPVLILKDTDNSGTGVGQIGYISFQDSGNAERAWIGYGSGTSTAMYITNGKGDVILNPSTGNAYVGSNLILHAGNYNSYAPTLTGGGASGTWGISITGNAATLGGYGPNQTGGTNTIVQRDSNGYIQNSYFYMSGGGSERNSSGLGYVAGFNSSDYYVRSYNSTAVASFLGLGSNAYTSTAYLPLTGGTLTGALGGTSATFSSSVTATSFGGNVYPYNSILGSGADASTGTVFAGSTSGYVSSIDVAGGGATNPNTIIFKTASVERLRIASTGVATFSSDVYVGGATGVFSTADRGTLQVNGVSTAILGLTIGNVAKGYLYHDGSSLTLYSYSGSTYLSNTSGNILTLYGPNVGIGITTPSTKFHVSGGNATLHGVIVGDDLTYGAPYKTVAFGSTGDGNNRILGSTTTQDGLYFMAATGRGFEFRPNGGTTGTFTIASTGAATFSSTVTVGAITALAPSGFGYDLSSYKVLIVGPTGNLIGKTLAFGVDVSGNPSGSFSGQGGEYLWRNTATFITPNSSNNGYNTLLSWNSSGQLTFNSAATFSSSVTSTELSYPLTAFNPSLAPRTGLSSMSIKMWDNYFYGTGLGSDYGTVMNYYGRGAHVDTQVYFDAGGGSWYRTAAYAAGWQSWQKYVTENGGTWNISISGGSATSLLLSASGSLLTQYGSGTIGYSYALTTGTTGLFPSSDNSNAIITVDRHPGDYYSQLGFSSNGQLYYRLFSATPINTSQAWQTIWTSGNFNPGAYLPLTGGTLTGTLIGTSASFTGNLNWQGINNGNPRSLAIGYSGGSYGQAAYGVTFTSGGAYNYAINDVVSLWEAYDGLIVRAAGAGTVGTSISWATVLDARRNTFTWMGNTILHAGNYNSYALPLTGGTLTGVVNNGTYVGATLHYIDATGINASYSGAYVGYRYSISNTNNATPGVGLDFSNTYYGTSLYSPIISFSSRSSSGTYNNTYASIFGVVESTAADSNWVKGGIKFQVTGTSGAGTVDKVYINERGLQVRSGNLYTDWNYGYGLVGLYASTRFQGIFAMGDEYKLPGDGTTTGSLYGLAWSHPNAGGVASNLNTHGLLVMENGAFLAAVSGSIRARDDMRAPIFYDSQDTSYYGDFNDQSRFNTLKIGNLGTFSAGTGYALQLSHNSRYLIALNYNNTSYYPWLVNDSAGGYEALVFHFNGIGDKFYFNRAGNMGADGTITASQFNGSGAGLTGTATGLSIGGNAATATNVAWSGVTSKPSNIMYYQGFTLDADTMDTNATGFTYAVNAPHVGPVARFSTGGGYDLWLNAPYSGGGNSLAFRTRNGDTATLNAWKDILHSGNYNSYSPTLTGGNASGTWGINITGSSSSTTYINHIGLGNATTNISSGQSQVLRNENGAGGNLSYAPVLHLAASDTMWQIQGDYSSSTTLKWRAGYSGTWYDWRTILHSGNYNSYAPTLTGGGASGTWGINVTGTAGSAPNASNANPYYNVTPGTGYGLRFWSSDSYKISMGASSLYYYGPVTDYSIKMQMDDGSAGRGFTWGRESYAPIAGLNATSGNMQIAGTFTASNFSGSSSGTNTGDQTNISGNAATVTITYGNDSNSNYYMLWGSGNSVYATGLIYCNPSTDTIYAAAYRGNANVGGTGEATYHPAGIFSQGTNWLYGAIYLSSNTIYDASDIYNNQWFRNNNSNTGLYNQVTTQHWSSNTNGYWDASSTTTVVGIRFYTGSHLGTLRGYVYADTASNIGFLNSAGSWSLRCDNSGNVIATGDVTAYSDARVKTNVETIENALDKVTSLRGVKYNRTDTDDKSEKIGVIAQEIQEVIPQVVNQGGDGMLGVSYGNLAGVFIEAIKEQQKQIEDLKKQIEFLVENR